MNSGKLGSEETLVDEQKSLPSELQEFSKLNQFSRRESDIFRLLANRVTTSDQIGKVLGLSPNTVSNHFKNLLQKSETNSKTELLALFTEFCLEKLNPWFSNSDLKPLQVVMADDEIEYFDLVDSVVKDNDLPLQITRVKDGDELFQFLKGEGSFTGKSFRPDLILLDLSLPSRHGREVLSELKRNENFCAIPVVVLTGTGTKDDIRYMYGLGASSYIEKPTRYENLVNMMKVMTCYWYKFALAATE